MVESLVRGARIDRYEVDRVMASGGQGTVALVKHVHLGSLHALKVLRVEQEAHRARLLREGRIQASLRHPNIVAVTDVVSMDAGLALVMEFVDGPDLFRWHQQCTPTVEEVDLIADQLFDALGAAHARGIIHRDIKPDNVLVERVGGSLRLRVTDFGLAVDEGDAAGRLTMQGAAMGTPRYMAPELYIDARAADARADLYGLGALLYELLAGEAPFAAGSVVESYTAAVGEQYPPLASRRTDVPARMEAAIVAAMRASADDRPRDIPAMRGLWRGDTPLPTTGFGPRALFAAAPRTEAHPVALTRSLPDDGSMSPAERPSLLPRSAASATTPPSDLDLDVPVPPPGSAPELVVVRRWPLVLLALGMGAVGLVLAGIAAGGWAWYIGEQASASVADQADGTTHAEGAEGAFAGGTDTPEAPTEGATAGAPSGNEPGPDPASNAARSPSPDAGQPSPTERAPAGDARASIAAPTTEPVAVSKDAGEAAPRAEASTPPGPTKPAATAATAPTTSSRPVEASPASERTPASVSVSGVTRARLVTDTGAVVPMGAAPPGVYALEVWFAGSDAETRVMTLSLAAGERRAVNCSAGLRKCQ